MSGIMMSLASNVPSAVIYTPLPSLANTKYLMLGAAVTTDTSGTQTVTNNGTVTQSATKPF